MKKIVLLSDTHNSLDARIFPHLKDCDEIWHAGDIGGLEIIETLETFAITRAVYGNIDDINIRKNFLETLRFKCENIQVIMTHIGGSPSKYNKEIKKILQKEKPNLFISGHSHILKIMYDNQLNLLHMNPGAIGNYGIHQVKTILAFNVKGKDIKNLRVIEYPRAKYES